MLLHTFLYSHEDPVAEDKWTTTLQQTATGTVGLVCDIF